MESWHVPASTNDIDVDLANVKWSKYGLPTIPKDPNGSKYYYLATDDNSHFITCAKMSTGSDAGNVGGNLASWSDSIWNGTTANNQSGIDLLNASTAHDRHCYVG
jgi:hypothetical protein